MRKYLLEPSSETNPASLWDYSESLHAANPDWTVVEERRFEDGSTAMLPEKQAVALVDIHDLLRADEDSEGGHIVHALRAVTLQD